MSKEVAYLNYRYIIVRFCADSSKKYELLPIDLVPNSWVSESKGKYFCKYPPQKDFELVDNWSKEEKVPEKGWKSYPVQLISSSGNH